MLNRLLQRVRPSTLLGFGGTAVCCAAAYRFAWQMEYQKSEGELHFWNKYVSNAVKLLAASTVSLAAGYALRKRLCAVEGMKRFLLAVAPLSLSGACGYVAHVNPLTDYHARDMWADAALMLGGVTVGIAGVYFWPHALGILSHLALNAPLAYLHTQSDGCYMEGMSPFVISLASVFLSVALNPFLGAAMGAQTISALSFVAAAGSAMGCMLPLHIFFRHRNIDVSVLSTYPIYLPYLPTLSAYPIYLPYLPLLSTYLLYLFYLLYLPYLPYLLYLFYLATYSTYPRGTGRCGRCQCARGPHGLLAFAE
ncbi:MAG: hypothetical protein MHM6MM_001131 [Cercozoa sp. M6MM]